MRQVRVATRNELLFVVSALYRDSKRAEKSRSLDEFAAVTEHHRKHAMRGCFGLVHRASGRP